MGGGEGEGNVIGDVGVGVVGGGRLVRRLVGDELAVVEVVVVVGLSAGLVRRVVVVVVDDGRRRCRDRRWSRRVLGLYR